MARDFADWLGVASEVGFANEQRGDTARPQKIRQKKWPLRGAAKFREETPRKGGGLATKDRDTALQQYAEVAGLVQVLKQTLRMFFPQKVRKFVKKTAYFFSMLVPFAPWCDAIKPSFPLGMA